MTAAAGRRFDRWRRRLDPRTAALVEAVLTDLVPLYEQAELLRHEDYAGGNAASVAASTIGLQRRAGLRWPTVEIQFDRGGKPRFNIGFAALPETCTRWTTGTPVPIPRLAANAVEGDAYFVLCKGERKTGDCSFGVTGISLFPDARISSDLALAISLSRWLVAQLETGLPEEWLAAPRGYVIDRVFKHPRLAG